MMKEVTRACRQDADDWERANDQAFFAAGKGRSPADPVWRRAVLAEVGTAKSKSLITALWDIAKFYERIGHGKLV